MKVLFYLYLIMEWKRWNRQGLKFSLLLGLTFMRWIWTWLFNPQGTFETKTRTIFSNAGGFSKIFNLVDALTPFSRFFTQARVELRKLLADFLFDVRACGAYERGKFWVKFHTEVQNGKRFWQFSNLIRIIGSRLWNLNTIIRYLAYFTSIYSKLHLLSAFTLSRFVDENLSKNLKLHLIHTFIR